MYDRETKSIWLQAEGRAVRGPLSGTHLKMAPMLDTTWANWRRLHPRTMVMSPDNPFRANYEPNGTVVERGFQFFPSKYFNRTLTRIDTRLPTFQMVLGVKLHCCQPANGAVKSADSAIYRAYPISELRKTRGVVNDNLASGSIAIFFDHKSETAVAVSRELEGFSLTFETRRRARGGTVIYDSETESQWTVEGRCIEGPLQGSELQRVDSYMSAWYGWAAYFPQTTIYVPTRGSRVAKSFAH